MQGILLVDKPATWTSFDVVNYVRRIVANHEGKKPKNCKVGHTGTLDPLATGLLVILVGKDYTRRATDLSKQDKVYDVTMRLGQTSTTGDEEGEKVPGTNDMPSEQAIVDALQAFTGDIMQTPPIYSAIKIDGQRAYKLAREGKAVTLEARPATVHSNTFVSYDYPLVRFTSHVSSGTYIRSLVEDLGTKLGTGAYMSGLRRTAIADFDVTNAVTPDTLDADSIRARLQTLSSSDVA